MVDRRTVAEMRQNPGKHRKSFRKWLFLALVAREATSFV